MTQSSNRALAVCLLAWAALAGPPARAQDVVAPGQPATPATPPRRAAAANRYIVTFAPGTSRAARGAAAQRAGVQVRYNYGAVDALAITAADPNSLAALRSQPGVLNIVPDRPLQAMQKGNGNGKGGGNGGGGGGPALGGTRQLISYEVQRVGPATANSHGGGIGVAVLDTGFDFNHTDLKPAPNAAGTAYNGLTQSDGNCQDDGGHGTHIAGLIAAQNNNQDIVGVAPDATLYCVKVLDGTLNGDESNAIAGLDWVLQNYNRVTPNIRVVNMSLGRPLAAGEIIDQTPLHAPIQALYERGVVVVVSAGNDPTVEVTQMVPAGYAEVLAIGGSVATNGINICPIVTYVRADTAAAFTTDGAFTGGRGVTISAPAEERSDALFNGFSCSFLFYGTLSTTLGGGATRKIPSQAGLFEARGTSFAAALVSGVVARVLQMQLVSHTANANEVENVRLWLRNNADRKLTAPLDHPWAGVVVTYNFDGEREGIVQAPK